MANRTVELKRIIFNALNNDITLRNLLGGTNKVRHANPLQVSEYPCVVYNFRRNDSRFFNEDERLNVYRTYLKVISFSTDTSETDVDDISDRVHEILHGKCFSSDIIQVYYVEEKHRISIYEDRIKVWRQELNFDVVNSIKKF